MADDNNVVLRYRDGRTERVTMAPVDADRQVLTVQREGGEKAEVPFSILKAVFFPQTEPEQPAGENGGSQLKVEFADGEVIRGLSSGYNPARNGFYLFPSDRSKSDKIYVVNSAIVSIDVEKL